jgi:hypothetical protein
MTRTLDNRDLAILAALTALRGAFHDRAEIAAKLGKKQLDNEDVIALDQMVAENLIELGKVTEGRGPGKLVYKLVKRPGQPEVARAQTDSATQKRRGVSEIISGAGAENKQALIFKLGELRAKALPADETIDRLSAYAEALTSGKPATPDAAPAYPKIDTAADTCAGWVGGTSVNASVTHVHMKYAILAAARLVIDDTAPFYFAGEGKREGDDFSERFWNIVAGIAENMAALTERLADLYDIDQLRKLETLE